MRKVLVGGCFDLLHYGHLTFLKQAAQVGDFLTIALEPDQTILQKGRPVLHCQSQRQEILMALRMVHQVICLPKLTSYEDYLAVVQQINPQVIAVTDEDPQHINKQRQAQVIGAEIVVVTPLLPDYSSSDFFRRIC